MEICCILAVKDYDPVLSLCEHKYVNYLLKHRSLVQCWTINNNVIGIIMAWYRFWIRLLLKDDQSWPQDQFRYSKGNLNGIYFVQLTSQVVSSGKTWNMSCFILIFSSSSISISILSTGYSIILYINICVWYMCEYRRDPQVRRKHLSRNQ